MGQVAFDTQEFIETLEKEGLPRNQAKAISLVVRQSHEVADLATKSDIKDVKRDLKDVRKDLSGEIADVRKDMEHRFEKVEAQITDVRRDITRLEIKFDRLQWFILAGILSLLFKDLIPKLWGG